MERMQFRIGVNLGDIIEKADGTVYGDGVNVAARLEALAEPGGIAISGTVQEQVADKVDAGFDYLGEQNVKNIARPIRVYRVRSPGLPALNPSSAGCALKRWPLVAAAALLLLVGGVALWRAVPAGDGPMELADRAEDTAETAVADDVPILALPKAHRSLSFHSRSFPATPSRTISRRG